jgi:hypothetical protein
VIGWQENGRTDSPTASSLQLPNRPLLSIIRLIPFYLPEGMAMKKRILLIVAFVVLVLLAVIVAARIIDEISYHQALRHIM